jgi:pyridinium-3,5-biscarboxylic acid mononucleotide synthase
MADREIRLDLGRQDRVGFDEAVLCAGKSDAQLAEIMDELVARDRGMLMTRLDADVVDRMSDGHRRRLDHEPVSRTGFFNREPGPAAAPAVGVVAAGSSDMPQVAEVVRTLTWFGTATETIVDVGVAGLWRLLDQVDRLRAFPVLVVAAGMDGALPSVLGGLVPGVVICLPTSTGYGAARGGETALAAALTSCAPGLTVVNIDNGYGAACAAFRAVRAIRRAAG